jgi:CheY-like chemotaxis protein
LRLQTAQTGTDALAVLDRDEKIDLLITDVTMPGMDGRQLAAKAKSLRRDLHVILASGREADGQPFPLLRKPFFRDDLERVMANTSGLC